MGHGNYLTSLLVLQLATYCKGTNIAVNKTASHLSSLDYSQFEWTADKAVDGCLNQDDPDNERCCSATEGNGAINFWTVDLGQQYSVGLIVVYGRYPSGEEQLSGFQVFTKETLSGNEILAYNNVGQSYGVGVFNITLTPARTVRSVVIKRPTGTIILLCEVEVYDFSITTTASNQGQQGFSTGSSVYQSTSIMTSLIMFLIAVMVVN